MNVSQSNNSYRYDSDQGYVYKEKTATEKEKIKILQINSSRTSTFNLQSEMANKNSKFHNLAVALEDFELNIKTISAGNYANAYTSTYLDDYDMIILGFGDMYSISDANGCLEGIRNFIEEGNPVLFTHDTTSLSNDSTGHNEWGYEFNTIIRDVVGMDRYASLNNDSVKSGRTICSDRDTAYRYGVWDYSDADAQKYISAIDFAKKNDTDLGYMPKSNKKVICRQNQGFTYLDMARFLSKSYNTYLAYAGLSTGNHSSTKVNQVNSGQITSYPYVLPESFTVSNTHYQYYQLDMNQDSDNDGESDIVVWYALTDNSGPYSLSPNDVRNNYYIYTMGNVTYSGVGHSSISNNVNELKLYINTMIAAYNSGVHAPEVKVLKTADDNSEDVGTLYVSMDDILKEQLDGKDATEDVFFRVDDNNLLRTGSERVEYADFCSVVSEDEYNENSKSTDYLKINEDGATVYLKKLKWDKYSVKDEKIITEGISSGVTYKVKVPLSIIDENHDSLKIYCVAYTRIIKKGVNGSIKKTIDSPVGFDSFRIQRVGLTDLD